MFHKIEKKAVFKKDEYLQVVATWRWFIASGGAKSVGYIITEYGYPTKSFQKHRKSALTAEHMIVYNLIRGRDPHKGFLDEDADAYRKACYVIKRNMEVVAQTEKNLLSLVQTGKFGTYALQSYTRSVEYISNLAKPFGLTSARLMQILQAAS